MRLALDHAGYYVIAVGEPDQRPLHPDERGVEGVVFPAREDVGEAEAVLLKALAASGNDLKVREHVEDRQLRWARHRVHVAEQRLQAEDTPAHRETLERLRAALLKHEVEIYSARCTRYPENLTIYKRKKPSAGTTDGFMITC